MVCWPRHENGQDTPPKTREETMANTQWTIQGREFGNGNCAYGCPCQFNALPTQGHCRGAMAVHIDRGHHGSTNLDGLRLALLFKWPGPVHLGNGEAQPFVDARANPAQRDALLRIMT